MAEFQELLDFPPAPKLGIDGKLDPAKATEAEMRGQELFFGSIDTLPHLRVQRRADVSLWAGGSPPSPERSR